jgi:ubiquinone/menaquinone biosynthesis C-methylase UbiE
MGTNLADLVDGVPGRFVPDEMRGQLVEAEHLTRYWWAADYVEGRRVLDAGCGIGYGAALMLAAGAGSVAGIDLAEDVVAAAAAAAPAGVDFDTGDVRALPYGDDTFDVATCFEVIEHVDDQAATLAELARVLAPGGLLLLSSPNRDVYTPGNPHHVHELIPAELEAMLESQWPNVRLLQQHNYLASTILAISDDDRAEAELTGSLRARRLVGKAAGDEVYTVAMASSAPLPDLTQVVMLASPVEIRQWLERYEEQQRILHDLHARLEERIRADADRNNALARLAEAEQAVAEVPSLQAAVASLRTELEAAARERDVLQARADRADAVLRDVFDSPSWHITAPLRAAKRLLRRR